MDTGLMSLPKPAPNPQRWCIIQTHPIFTPTGKQGSFQFKGAPVHRNKRTDVITQGHPGIMVPS